MSERIHTESTESTGSEDQPDQQYPVDKVETEVDEAAIKDILDEIDGLLEPNAEAFVQGFVQKGGQ